MGLTVTFKVLDRDRPDLAKISLLACIKTLMFEGGFRNDECACLHFNRKYISFFYAELFSVRVLFVVFMFQPKCLSAKIV